MNQGQQRSTTHSCPRDYDLEFLTILKSTLRVTRQVLYTASPEESPASLAWLSGVFAQRNAYATVLYLHMQTLEEAICGYMTSVRLLRTQESEGPTLPQ